MSIKGNIIATITVLIAEECGPIPDDAALKLISVRDAVLQYMPDLPQVSLTEYAVADVDGADRLSYIDPPYANSSRKDDVMQIQRIGPMITTRREGRVGLVVYGKGSHRLVAMSPAMWRTAMALIQAQIALIEKEK